MLMAVFQRLLVTTVFYRPETFDFATSVYVDNSQDYTLCVHMMYIFDYFTDMRLVTFRPPA